MMNTVDVTLKYFLKSFDSSQSLAAEIFDIFKILLISPHFVQELYMKIICDSMDYSHKFFTIAPGLGKTKLILCHAIYLVQTYKVPVIILNSSMILSDRDFVQAIPFIA